VETIHVGLKLPFFEVSGDWKPDDAERTAAWKMYVELVTRISVAELPYGVGVLREALSSLYSLFATTREILKEAGPEVARPKKHGQLSFGYIAVAVLNGALRPLLSRWHPELEAYELTREPNVSRMDHERRWDRSDELRRELKTTTVALTHYANLLAQAAGTPSLLEAVAGTEQSGKTAAG
jgi:hypothetical protein